MRLSNRTLSVCISFTFLIISFFTQAHESDKDGGVSVEKLLETEKSWDGVSYQAYPKGTPQLSVLKITIAPNSALAWHEHPIPNAAYVLEGALTVEKKANGQKRTLKAGEVVSEMVDSAHRTVVTQVKRVSPWWCFTRGKKASPCPNPPDNRLLEGGFSSGITV